MDQKSNLPIAPITSALRFNTFFRCLSAIHVARKDMLYHCSHIFRHNTHITKLVLSQLHEGNLTELFDALYYNTSNAIQILDLSGTHIHRGITSLCFSLQHFNHALRVLKLADTGLDGRQVANIMNALSSNFGMSLTIEELDLSHNKFDDIASNAFERWISKAAEYSSMSVLRLAFTGITLASVAAFLHFLQNLQVLDTSGNKPDSRAIQLLCSMAEKSTTLKELNLSHCNLSGRYAANVCIAMLKNQKLSKTTLNLSNNEFAESDADILSSSLSHSYNVHILDLSKNKFKEKGLISILQSIILSGCRSLDTLLLNGIYRNSFAGERVANAIMSVINSLTSLSSLSISGGFATVCIPLMEYLQTNTTLLELDISNNALGDEGSFAISQLLRKNKTLLSIKCDGNNISPTGWKMILASFMHNHTLVFLDLPWNDYNKAAPNLPEDKLKELRAVLIDIQRALQTTHNNDNERLQRFLPQTKYVAPADIKPKVPVPKKLRKAGEGFSSLAVDKVHTMFGGSATSALVEQFRPANSPPSSPQKSHSYRMNYKHKKVLNDSATDSATSSSAGATNEDEIIDGNLSSSSSESSLSYIYDDFDDVNEDGEVRRITLAEFSNNSGGRPLTVVDGSSESSSDSSKGESDLAQEDTEHVPEPIYSSDEDFDV